VELFLCYRETGLRELQCSVFGPSKHRTGGERRNGRGSYESTKWS
jgi:hypothetical protein